MKHILYSVCIVLLTTSFLCGCYVEVPVTSEVSQETVSTNPTTTTMDTTAINGIHTTAESTVTTNSVATTTMVVNTTAVSSSLATTSNTNTTKKTASTTSAAATTPAITEKTIALNDDRVRYLGRSVVSPIRVMWDHACTGFELRLYGTAISVKLEEQKVSAYTSHYGVWIDGERTQTVKLNTGTNTVVLAEGLPEAEHTIRLVKLNEMRFTRSDLTEITVVGDLLERPSDKKLHIEFIGDSLTAGFGNLTSNPNQDYTSDTQDATQTYASETAALLNADYSVVAVSGWGLAQDCDGNVVNNLPKIYDYATYYRKPTKWDFEKASADVVVINLGTNDFSSKVDADRFTEVVESFTKTISEKNPQAKIVWCYGLATDNGLNVVKSAVEKAAQTVEHVYFVELPKMNTELDGVGGLWHPSIASHKKAGAVLAAALEEILKAG